MVDHMCEHHVRIRHRSRCYSFQFRFRRYCIFCGCHDVSPTKSVFTQCPSPCITAFPDSEYYDTSDFQIDFLEFLIRGLVPQYCFRSSITSAYAYGLQCLLPTLNLLHYCNMPKARYEMCWVSTFSTALSAASIMALSWRTDFAVFNT